MTAETPPDRLSLVRARSRGLFGAVLVFSVFTNLLMLTGPLFMLQVYDRVLTSRSEETLAALFLLVAALYFFYWLLEFARGRVMARIGARLQAVFGRDIFAAAIRRRALDDTSETGVSALQDLEGVRTLLGAPVLLAFFDLPWTPLFLAAIFIFHPLLGWLALLGGGLLIGVALLNRVLTTRRLEGAQRSGLQAQRLARQAEEGGAFVWAQGMTAAMADRWARLQDKAGGTGLAASDWTGVFSSFSKAFRFFLQSAVLALGAWLVLRGELTPGAMIAASILLGRALAPIEQLLGQWPMIQRGRSGWRRLTAFLAAAPGGATPTELPVPEARLKLSDVALRGAPGAPPILAGIDFELVPGEALGVLGRSGAGKTSLARLVLGLVQPGAGELRLAGATLDQYGNERLGRYLGSLPQDVRFFDGTVAENIAQMALAPEAERVVAAAKRARVHDIVVKLPQGYDTPLTEGSPLLSGGQRQRLALARALYNDPVILVLDEPNSALDAEGSEALTAVVADMKQAGKSVLIMTHRPSAIVGCDRLLVLEGGRQRALGPRDEIIAAMMRNAGDVKRAVGRGGGSGPEATQ